MLPILLLVGVPSAAGTFYVMWGQGQSTAMMLSTTSMNPPPSTLLSSCSGIATVVGVYGAQGLAIRYFEGDSPSSSMVDQSHHKTGSRAASSDHAQSSSSFKPPKGAVDVLKRVGKPALLHVGAASVAFFFAGMVQTKVALWQNPGRRQGK
mmetsp:Transcript_50267/g.75059  ORF Transcript_50267/g.75059 Transcript_50267/m.75059 type:complete len:151 (-) Transcript_50267:1805-2257(-)